VVGAESTGKSTLAAALVARLDAQLCSEYARTYFENNPHCGYTINDVYTIAETQMDMMQAAYEIAQTQQKLLICDTSMLVIEVWLQYKFGKYFSKYLEWEMQWQPIHYLLTSHKVPWQPDVLREHPNERQAIHNIYVQLLDIKNCNYTQLSGTTDDYVLQALNSITLLK
jgi:Predicted ATPase/kinase involved in NAD metabolism